MTERRSTVSWPRLALVAAIVAVAAVLALVLFTGNSDQGQTAPRPEPLTGPVADADAFLSQYVESNGRVSRLDQGGDTVSEGQAYALLLAEVADRPQLFAKIWRWTAGHLQQRNGLLAWHATAAGAVQDPTPASDADLLTAWALSRASGRGSAEYHAQARRMAGAVLAQETTKQGPLLLAAGPWATGSPASLDPSYWSAPAFAGLAKFTGDSRWNTLASNATAYAQALTGGGTQLPPDWAKLVGSTATPEPAPNGSASSTQYGLDAERLVVWSAASCNPADRQLAAGWWRLLAQGQNAGALSLSTSGDVIDAGTNALPYVAAAAAADADGDQSATESLLAQATKVQQQSPTYYGGAWLALGQALLTKHALGSCAGYGQE